MMQGLQNMKPGADRVPEDEMRHRIALTVTFFLFLLFAPPTLLCVHLGIDPDVAYWVGRGSLSVLVLPVLFMALFGGMHARGAKKAVITAAFLMPAVMFAAIGGVYMNSCEMAYAHLISQDCSVPREKAEIQGAYDSAMSLYDTCLARTGINLEDEDNPYMKPPSVASCDEYRNAVARDHPLKEEWDYLAHMELNFVCGGFCKPGRPLWVRSLEVHEACAPFAASKMWTASHQSSQILVYGIIVMALYIPMYILILSPALATYGYHNVD